MMDPIVRQVTPLRLGGVVTDGRERGVVVATVRYGPDGAPHAMGRWSNGLPSLSGGDYCPFIIDVQSGQIVGNVPGDWQYVYDLTARELMLSSMLRWDYGFADWWSPEGGETEVDRPEEATRSYAVLEALLPLDHWALDSVDRLSLDEVALIVADYVDDLRDGNDAPYAN